MAIEIRPIIEEELDTYIDAVVRAFGGQVQEGEHDRVRRVIGVHRCHGAFDDRNRMVGTTGSFGLQMAVPGAVDVATAGLTRVTVAASHRRQGILTSMIDAHFDDAAGNGEPLSALWASEVAIYGRYGYGLAGTNVAISYDARIAGIARPDQPDTIDLVDRAEAEKAMPELRERSRIGRPGKFARSPVWWEVRRFPDHEWMRDGASPRRFVIASRNGEPVGYAAYRQKTKWTETDLPEGEVGLIELAAIDTVAEHTLWWFLSNIDLFPKIAVWTQPPDSILPWLATNSRAMKQIITDGLHLRVLDVEAALSSRRYEQPGLFTFELVDPQLPDRSGTYRLAVADDGTATCTRSDEAPDASLSAYALGALYLGSTRPEPLALADHLRADYQAVAAIRRMFGWPVAAWCDENF